MQSCGSWRIILLNLLSDTLQTIAWCLQQTPQNGRVKSIFSVILEML